MVGWRNTAVEVKIRTPVIICNIFFSQMEKLPIGSCYLCFHKFFEVKNVKKCKLLNINIKSFIDTEVIVTLTKDH